MKLARRKLLHLAAGAAALPAVSRVVQAQTYPDKPLRLVNGFAAGGTADIFARLMGQWLSERLGQQFLTENRTGAASNIATEAVVRAPADGYTLLLATPANAINATLYEKLTYDFIRDTAPVAGIMVVANVMEVIPRYRLRRFRNSSPMPRPTLARSTWHRAAPEARPTSSANCSSL